MWRRAVLLLLLLSPVQAAPPADGGHDPILRRWFESLMMPGTRLPCCSISDCRRVGYRVVGRDHQVNIHGQWYIVPAEAVVRTENPTGEAIACYMDGAFARGATPAPPYVDSPHTDAGILIRCFVPPPGV